MKKILATVLLVLLTTTWSQAATRIYFGGGINGLTTHDFFITPTPDAGWEETGALKRAEMHVGTPLRARGQAYGESAPITVNTANQALAMQYQMLMPAGVTFTSGVTTFKMYGTVREGESDDDVNQCITGIRIIDDDGTTVNATLFAVANYGSTLEFATGGGVNRNHTCANGDTVTATYTTVTGDWMVLERGFATDGSHVDADSNGSSWFTDGSGFTDNGDTPDTLTSGDCGENNTDTNCTAWAEFSNTWSAPTDAGPATRMWLQASQPAAVNPAPHASWEQQNEEVYRRLTHVKSTSAMVSGVAVLMSQADWASEVDRVYVSDPMPAGIVFTKGQTTVSGQSMVRYINTTDDLRSSGIGVSIRSYDGSTVRAVLLVPFPIGQTEFSTTFRNQSLARGTAVIENYTTVIGDRVVVEHGYWMDDDGSASTTPQGQGQFGEDATDCTALAFTGTTTCAPWVQFSNALAFINPRPTWFAKFLMIEPMGVVRGLRSFLEEFLR